VNGSGAIFRRIGLLALAIAALAVAAAAQTGRRPNILLITADDMNCDSVGAFGCPVDGITPNIDRLAAEGLRFEHAHVTSAVCQPCRQAMMTGRYPFRAGVIGFMPVREDVPTLAERLHAENYLLGILGKVNHLRPAGKFPWDFERGANALGHGRDPGCYHRHARAFFERAREAGRPFFLMANSQDPHRPFAGSDQEKRRFGRRKKKGRPGRGADDAGRSPQLPPIRRRYAPREVPVPGFLPDLPAVRLEMSEYYASVHRADETVGAVLRALRESGLEDRTLVVFLSDHGMPLPFVKTNCYRHSTRTPWIVRWPGRIKAGQVNRKDLINGIDFMPTVLDAVGAAHPPGMDGRSFLGLLLGQKHEGREAVFTYFDRTAGRRDYPMRAVQDRRFGYIVNFWSDGKSEFKNESQNGRTMRAMRKAARQDKNVASRVDFFLRRAPEELYDYERDPDALHNLATDPKWTEKLRHYRRLMREHLESTGDPHLEAYRRLLASKPQRREQED